MLVTDRNTRTSGKSGGGGSRTSERSRILCAGSSGTLNLACALVRWPAGSHGDTSRCLAAYSLAAADVCSALLGSGNVLRGVLGRSELAKTCQRRSTSTSPNASPQQKGPVTRAFFSGSDGTRTRDLRRDRPTQALSGAVRCRVTQEPSGLAGNFQAAVRHAAAPDLQPAGCGQLADEGRHLPLGRSGFGPCWALTGSQR